MKKKSYLWVGLAVPVIAGGVTAFLKMKKPNTRVNGKGKAEDVTRNPKYIPEGMTEKPDLDKDVNPADNLKSPEKRRPKIRESIKQEQEKKEGGSTNNRKVYTGAKGGKYYLNQKGEKVYLKK